MKRGYVIRAGVGTVVLALVLGACSKDESPSTPAQQGGSLRATPTSVTVSASQTIPVTISDGVPPYSVAAAPNAGLATVQLQNANLDTAILSITGVTTATGATSVRVKDSTPAPEKQVTVQITKVQ